MAKTVDKKATVETAYGNTLATPVKFTYSYVELEKGDEIPADEQPDSDAIRSFVNQRRNAAARSKAQNDALQAAGIEKPTLENRDVAIATMVKAMVAQGIPEAQARQIAETALAK